jgi:hypothetical protein
MASEIEFKAWHEPVVYSDDPSSSLALPGKTAFLSILCLDQAPSDTESSLLSEEIRGFGGYISIDDSEEIHDGQRVASFWSINTNRDADTVSKDLIANGVSNEGLASLKATLSRLTQDKSVVIIAARDMASRRASALCAFSRRLEIKDEAVHIEVQPLVAIGREDSHSWSMVKAAVHLQLNADYESLVFRMATSGAYKPIETTVNEMSRGRSCLVAELPGAIEMAQDQTISCMDEFAHIIDLEKVEIRPVIYNEDEPHPAGVHQYLF